jgi:outer membrane lipoprotein-sorting protein
VKETPEQVRNGVTALLARSGLGVMLIRQGKKDDKEKEDPLKAVQVSEVKGGKEEKVGDRKALVLTYKLTIRNEPVAFAGTVWLDVQTNLPLKRTLSAEVGGERFTLTETYSDFRLNPKLDARTFELPKPKGDPK